MNYLLGKRKYLRCSCVDNACAQGQPWCRRALAAALRFPVLLIPQVPRLRNRARSRCRPEPRGVESGLPLHLQTRHSHAQLGRSTGESNLNLVDQLTAPRPWDRARLRLETAQKHVRPVGDSEHHGVALRVRLVLGDTHDHGAAHFRVTASLPPRHPPAIGAKGRGG